MPIYAGLDVSDKATHVCVVDVEGAVLMRSTEVKLLWDEGLPNAMMAAFHVKKGPPWW